MASAKVYNGEVSEELLFKISDDMQQNISQSTLPDISLNSPISSSGSILSSNIQMESSQNTYDAS